MADQDAFVAAPSFEGPRSGCVFTTGERGTGYYRDSGTASASPAAARSGGDDAELQAELQGLGLSGQAEPIAEPVTEAEASAAVEKPPALAKRAEAAFEAASKLTRGGGGGAPPPPSSSEPLPEGGGGGVTGGGGSAGYDHLHPGALAKYRESLALYTEALQHSPVELCDPDLSSAERSKYLSCRAEVRIRLEQFGAAVHDCDVAIALASSDAAKAATEKRKRRAASMAVKIARRAEDTASKTMVSAAETIKQNKDLAKELAELDPETAKGGLKSMTLMAAVTKLKNRGNEAFKAKRWGAAAEDYRAGIVVIDLAQQEARREREAQRAAHLELDGDDYVSEIVESVEVSEAWPGEALNLRNLHGNLAAALLGLEDWKAAEESAFVTLELDVMWGKARYRLGCAMEGCAEDELCAGAEQRDAAIAKFREAHGAYAGALALSEGRDKASTAAMKRIESRLAGLGATVQKEEDDMSNHDT